MTMKSERHKGIIHFHSSYSFDSISSAKSLLDFAERHRLSFMILTDHDTVEGSRHLRQLAKERNSTIEIPLAAEYSTDSGDLIAAFIKEEIALRNADELVKEIKNQGGISLLPHPFVGHKNIDHLASIVDMIEVFNGRQSSQDDLLSEKLSQKYNKPVFFSSDAHLVRSLGDVVLSLDKRSSLKDDLLTNKITPISTRKTNRAGIHSSHLIGVLKKRQFGKLLKAPAILIRDIFGKS